MSDLEQLTQIDWWQVFLATCLLLFSVRSIWSLVDWIFIDKLGIKTRKMRQRDDESELLKTTYKLAKMTSENLDKLQARHAKDEEDFRKILNNYIEESRKDSKIIHDEISNFTKNRINDRQQSLEIQKELKKSISKRDIEIEALVIANKEILAEKINEKYKHYISINGIPEDEYDEFVSMHNAYNGVGGNHHGDAKFEYCIEHLPIIPVETKLIYKQ